MLILRTRSKIVILEKINKKIKKKSILMIVVMVISYIEPLLTQAQLEAFIGLSMLVACTNHGFVHMGLDVQNHRLKPWFCEYGFACTKP